MGRKRKMGVREKVWEGKGRGEEERRYGKEKGGRRSGKKKEEGREGEGMGRKKEGEDCRGWKIVGGRSLEER